MRSSRFLRIVCLIAALVTAPLTAEQNAPHKLVGQKLPALSLNDFAGKSSTLASHLDKPTFISFWASWCGPCLKEMPELDALLAKHPGEFQVVAIAMGDTVAAATAAKNARAALKFQWFLDPEAKGAMSLNTTLGKAFSVIALPTAAWIASDGTVVDYWNGLPPGEGELTRKVESLLKKR